MPLTGLAPLDSSWQPARFFVINDRRLQANRVDHRSFAGFSLHNLGSGQQIAAGARRRGRRSAHRSAVKFSCSGGATMWHFQSPFGSEIHTCATPIAMTAPRCASVVTNGGVSRRTSGPRPINGGCGVPAGPKGRKKRAREGKGRSE